MVIPCILLALHLVGTADYRARMTFKWLKSILPKGLYGRAALILLVPVISIQLVVTVVFVQRHFDGVTQQMSVNIGLDVGLILARINAAQTPQMVDSVIHDLAAPLGYAIKRIAPPTPRPTDQRSFFDLTGSNVITFLRESSPAVVAVDLTTDARRVGVTLDTRAGPIFLAFDRSRISAAAPHQLLVLMILISVLMTLISIIFLRNQVRPIRRLARAAEAFGRGRNIAYRVSGATEVRAAGQAFLDMRARIERHIEQHTLMLSGVSHDLRTPLTRLKLGLSLADPNEETAGLIRDVDEMEIMLNEFLAFARGDGLEEPQPCDVAQLARQVVAAAKTGAFTPELVLPTDADQNRRVSLRPNAIRRALENLISNAARYGNRCRVTVLFGKKTLSFVVEDNGPGIPLGQRDNALRPFMRLDQARNQDRGSGVGLGLSIVTDIASSHGGTLELYDSEDLGGLKIILTLPR